MASTKSTQIGLALSGGGFRASLFHMGAMMRLQELRALERVTHISGVSGGALAAACYGAALSKFEQSRKAQGEELHSEDYEKAFEEYERILLTGIRRNVIIRWLGQRLFSSAGMVIGIVSPGADGKILGKVSGFLTGEIRNIYDDLFYQKMALSELPESVRIIINATYLNPAGDQPEKERLFYFTRDYMGTDAKGAFEGPVSEKIKKEAYTTLENTEEVRIAEGVVASTAVPGVFVPYGREFKFTKDTKDHQQIVRLSDGGVYDNEGFYVFLDEWGKNPRSRVDFLIGSDAAGIDMGEPAPSQAGRLLWRLIPRLSTIMEMITIMKDHIRTQNFALLRNKAKMGKEAAKLDQYSVFHISTPVLDDLPYRLPYKRKRDKEGLDFPPALGRLRTQLDAFDDLEIRALVYHGYTMMNARVMQFCWGILPEDVRPWYQQVRAAFMEDRGIDAANLPVMKWEIIREFEEQEKVPEENRLPDLKDWQTFNREMDEKLRRYGYTLKWSSIGQQDPRAAESQPEFERALQHLEASAITVPWSRGLARFGNQGPLQKLLARLLQVAVIVAVLSIVVLLLNYGINRLLSWLDHARIWIQELLPGFF